MGARIAPFSPTSYISYKVTQGSWWGAWGWISPWMTSSPYWMNNITMSRPWMLWTRNLFSSAWVTKRQYWIWGVCLSRHLQILMVSFPEHFPPDCIAKLKCDHFYGGLPKWLIVMVAYLKASTNEKTYCNYLWAVREAEKEEVMETSHSQMAHNQP